MKNTLADLNNYLFQALEEVQCSETTEELETAIKKGKAVRNISQTIVQNAALQLNALKVAYNTRGNIPEVIGIETKI